MRSRNKSLPLMLALAAAISTGLATQAQAAFIQGPVSLTGWNQDIIAEKTAANPQVATTIAIPDNWSWYEVGAPNSTQGLPSGGLITSGYGANVQFQLQPYAGNNAVYLAGGSATVTLTSPAMFQTLQFLNSAQRIGGTISWDATLNFSDASTTLLSSVDPDWTLNGNNAVTSVGVVDRNTSWGGPYHTGQLNIFEHDFTLAPADQLKTLQSITLAPSSDGNLMFFALSGAAESANSVPEPSTVALLALGGLGIWGSGRRGRKRSAALGTDH